jgi:hypothetical protein
MPSTVLEPCKPCLTSVIEIPVVNENPNPVMDASNSSATAEPCQPCPTSVIEIPVVNENPTPVTDASNSSATAEPCQPCPTSVIEIPVVNENPNPVTDASNSSATAEPCEQRLTLIRENPVFKDNSISEEDAIQALRDAVGYIHPPRPETTGCNEKEYGSGWGGHQICQLPSESIGKCIFFSFGIATDYSFDEQLTRYELFIIFIPFMHIPHVHKNVYIFMCCLL